MGFYKIHRNIVYSSEGNKTITIIKGRNAGTIGIAFNLSASKTLLQDLSTCFTQCGLQHTIDLDDLSVTLSDGLKFHFGLNSSNYVGAAMDGDYYWVTDEDSISVFARNPVSIINGQLKYDMYVYTTEDGGFSIEMSNNSFESIYHILTMQKVYNPSDPTDYLWFSAQIMNNSSNNTNGYYFNAKRFHKVGDLTNLSFDPYNGVAKDYVFIPLTESNKLNVMFSDDYSTSNNYTLRTLTYAVTVDIPNYFVVNTSLTKGLNFDDGQYKYHILYGSPTSIADNIRIAVKYDTV